MKNQCASILKLLNKYFDQEDTPKERIFVEDHLKECLSCQKVLRSMKDLKSLINLQIREATRGEDLPWLWQKIERGIHLQEKETLWPSIQSWLSSSPLLRKKVWIPAVVTIGSFLLMSTQLFYKKIPSHPDLSVVEYIESQTHNIMVYEFEKPKVTLIWLFDVGDKDSTVS